jgi:CheY-like chemotaxis protein
MKEMTVAMKKKVGGKRKKEAEVKNQIILVVDGRPIRQFYTSIFLQRLNYEVITVKTAEDALMYLALFTPLVIIVNIDLPQMSGADLLKKVKSDPETLDIPVIIYTSNTNPRVRKECEEAGCADYLVHPDSLGQLYSAVQKAENKPRRFVRLGTRLDVSVGDGHDKPSEGGASGSITLLSEGGMFVSIGEPIACGAVCPFTFQLPNAPGWVIRVEGQILYHQLREDLGMGVKFLKIGDQEKEFIKDFIKGQLMEGFAAE